MAGWKCKVLISSVAVLLKYYISPFILPRDASPHNPALHLASVTRLHWICPKRPGWVNFGYVYTAAESTTGPLERAGCYEAQTQPAPARL